MVCCFVRSRIFSRPKLKVVILAPSPVTTIIVSLLRFFLNIEVHNLRVQEVLPDHFPLRVKQRVVEQETWKTTSLNTYLNSFRVHLYVYIYLYTYELLRQIANERTDQPKVYCQSANEFVPIDIVEVHDLHVQGALPDLLAEQRVEQITWKQASSAEVFFQISNLRTYQPKVFCQ